MRKTVVTLAFGAMIAPAIVAAQDATKAVAGGGELAPGWQMRIDPRAGSGTPPKFVAMGSGFHATSGSRAIYWRPAMWRRATTRVSATFTLDEAARPRRGVRADLRREGPHDADTRTTCTSR